MSRAKEPPQVSKRCAQCATEKDASAFYVGTAGRLRSQCKACYADFNKQQSVRHSEQRQTYEAARGPGWVRSGRAKWAVTEAQRWGTYVRRTYGISLDQAEQMFAIQQTACAVCRRRCNRSTTHRLCIDHDHASGRVRGLLCFQCNVGLGKFRDSAELLQRAAAYLECIV